jgi:hypothetical protein
MNRPIVIEIASEPNFDPLADSERHLSGLTCHWSFIQQRLEPRPVDLPANFWTTDSWKIQI